MYLFLKRLNIETLLIKKTIFGIANWLDKHLFGFGCLWFVGILADFNY